MAISASEQITLVCPACTEPFEAEVWTLVDAGERPDLAQALHNGTLDRVVCPHCDAASTSGAPLLFHDGAQRRVYFAVPPDADEHRWRERAQELLYTLVDHLPEEARLPYLGDVQVEQEIGGVQRAVVRRQRRAAARNANATPPAAPIPVATEQHAPPHPTDITHEPVALTESASQGEPSHSLFDTLQELLGANSAEEFEALVEQHPALLGPAAEALLRQLIEEAAAQGEHEISAALQTVRATLRGMRGGSTTEAAVAPEETAPAPQALLQEPTNTAPATRLSDAAYGALLHVSTNDELLQMVREYPVLLESWVDDELGARIEAVLEEGNERLAVEIDERRDVLAALRTETADTHTIFQAVEALLGARDEQALERVLMAYPALLTEAAQTALLDASVSSRKHGDEARAEYAAECRSMLHSMRAQLEA